MLSRLVLALVLAVPPFLSLVATSLESEQTYLLVVRMSTTTSGGIQLFPDAGLGYRQDRAVALPLTASYEARDYRLPLRAGRYKSLRIDPGNAPGLYDIERITVLGPTGDVVTVVPLSALVAAHDIEVIERTSDRLVVRCPPGAHDPQLVYAPAEPLWLLPSGRTAAVLGRWLAFYVAVGFVVLWAAELVLGRWAVKATRLMTTIGRGGAAHPQAAVMVAALVATCLAMYPLLFFGRSLVTPNNGGAAMLYGQPPFVPGSGDFEVEDVRGVDVGAMMWAFVPYSKMQREALADGEFPLWNRHAGPGVSLWGQGQSFFLDPLHWLTLLGRDEAPGWDLKFAAHRFVLSWGVGVAALAAPVAWLPAVVAAAVAPFIGFFAFRLNHPVAFALSYAPWVLAGWFLLARATSRRQLAGATLLLACASALVLFASPPKEGLVVLLVAEATGLLGLVLHVRPLARLPGRLGLSGLAGVAVVLVTMPQWLVFLETLRASVTNYDAPAVHFANPGYTIGMVLGGLTEGMPVPGLNTCSMALLVAALLSPAALLRSRAILACVAGAAAAIAVAHGVIPAAWIEAVPLAANIHSISVTFLTAALVPLLVASALGASPLLQRSRARVILMTLGTLAAAAWTFDGVGGVAGLGRFPAWLALVALAGAVILPLTVHASVRTFPRVLPALAVAGLGLLLLSPDGQHLDTGRPPIDRVLVQPRERVPLSLSSPAVDAIHDTATVPVRVLGLDYNLLPGTPALYDLEGVGGPDALYLGHADELRFAARPEARRSWLAVFRRTDLARQAPLLDMLNVGYLLAAFDQADSIGPAEPLRAPDVLRAIPRPTAWPRAFFAGRVSTYSTPEALIEQVRRAGRPMAAIQDGDAAAAALTSGLLTRRDAVVPADNYVLTTNTTQFHLRTGAGGVAVLAESYMPDDFIATVNGAEVPYFRVNHAFKAVVIPAAGEWTVKFEYRPHHWHLALAAAGGGALILFALAIAALPRARRNP